MSDRAGNAIDEEPDRLAALGWSDRWRALLADVDEPGEPGRIVRHDGMSVLVDSARGEFPCRLGSGVEPVTAGDWVVVTSGTVAHLLPRSSLLRRRDPSSGDAQLLAANVDVVGVACGLDRPVRTGRIQRFTTLAWDAGATPLVILSKADLATDVSGVFDEIVTDVPGSEVLAVSATEGRGVTELLERCAGSTLVLVGESGAGKSTLLNALAGREAAATAAVRRGDHKGRHTTTTRRLHVLAHRVCLIDTPGVREVGVATDVDTVDAGFDDIAALAAGCRFADCAHGSEPGCAVREAVTSGDLSAGRLQQWDKLRREAASAEIRADPAASRAADRRTGRMYREIQRMKRRNR